MECFPYNVIVVKKIHLKVVFFFFFNAKKASFLILQHHVSVMSEVWKSERAAR